MSRTNITRTLTLKQLTDAQNAALAAARDALIVAMAPAQEAYDAETKAAWDTFSVATAPARAAYRAAEVAAVEAYKAAEASALCDCGVRKGGAGVERAQALGQQPDRLPQRP